MALRDIFVLKESHDECRYCGKVLTRRFFPNGKPESPSHRGAPFCDRNCFDAHWEKQRQEQLAWEESERKRKANVYPAKPGGCKQCGGDIKSAYIDTDLCTNCLFDRRFKEKASDGEDNSGLAYQIMMWAKNQFV